MKINKSAKKLIIVLMSLTVALAGIAVGYGHWQDQLDINVGMTAAVGNLCFGFSQTWTDDPWIDTNNHYDHTCTSPWCDEDYHMLGQYPDDPIPKDVGWCEAEWVDPQEDCGGTCGRRVLVTIDNAYPSYAAKTTVVMKNCGQSAVTITDEFFYLTADMLSEGFYYHPYSDTVNSKCGFIRKQEGAAPNPITDPAVLDLCWFNFEGEVLASGDRATAEMIAHVLQPAEQGRTYTFYLDVDVWAY